MLALGSLSVLLAYLVGAVPVGYLLVRWTRGEDIRATGSGATGATNVTRALGLVWGLLTLALDVGKGYAGVEVAARLTSYDPRWMAAAGLAALLGHSYPVFLRFRGGRSVATGVGVFLHFSPLGVLGALLVWLLAVAIWRYVSLASVLAAAAYPLLALALQGPPLVVNLAAVAGACLIILRHRSNLQRLGSGTEPRLELKGKG